jgi:hypothetical protein
MRPGRYIKHTNILSKADRSAPHVATDSDADLGPTSVTGRYFGSDTLPTVGLMSAVRVPTTVPTSADRHLQVPTCADRVCRGRRLRGAVPPIPRGFVGTKFAFHGYSEDVVQSCKGMWYFLVCVL